MNPPTFVESSPVTVHAYALARECHDGQRRKADGADFVLHPLEVAAILDTTGAADHVVAAGLLHDVLEKSDITPWEIEARCGARVREIVEAVSEDPTISERGERKADLRRRAARSGGEPAMVFAADKISKLREWRIRLACGEEPPEHTMLHYRESLEAVAGAIPRHPLTGLLRFELEALVAFPPSAVEGSPSPRLAGDAG